MLPIKHFIYVNQRLKNLLLYRELATLGINTYGIRTDSLLVNTFEEEKLRNLFASEFDKGIGGFKIEYEKVNCDKRIEMKNLELIGTNTKQVHTDYLKSEEFFF